MGRKAGYGMNIQEYLYELPNKPMFFVLYCTDSDLRPIYINKFVQAHNGVPTYRDTLELGKQPRMIGKKPVYIVVNWEPGRKNPKPSYAKTQSPVLLVYTTGSPTQAQETAYDGKVVEIPPVTGAQVTTLLAREGLTEDIIDFLKTKTDSTQEALLIGKQVASLSKDLQLDISDCFGAYFFNSLKDRNIDEEPIEFLQAILNHNATFCFDYIQSQQGNEFFVFASMLNWIEDIIKYCSCEGDYWNNAGLVAARYKPFREAAVQRVPYLKWVKLYEDGLEILQSIKINQPNPNACLEVFLCHVIRTLM